VRVRVHFCTRDPNPTRAELGLGAGFVFHLRVHPKPEKNLKPERNLKNLKPKKNSKPERNSKEIHLQNPTGTRTRLETRRVRVSNSTRLHFFAGRIFGRPDLNLTRCHP
jgi:hypothetical protein